MPNTQEKAIIKQIKKAKTVDEVEEHRKKAPVSLDVMMAARKRRDELTSDRLVRSSTVRQHRGGSRRKRGTRRGTRRH
jgi:hypothetical protein